MESNENLDSNKPINKGKGIDRIAHPFYDGENPFIKKDSETIPLSKGKKIEPNTVESFAIGRHIFSETDITSIIPKRTNPGPGFNVPGGEVPIHDHICQHIDYNSHILNQFKKMDLETAIQQRNNNLTFVKVINTKLAHAHDTLTKVPLIPTNEYELKLRNQILRDLNSLSRDKVRAEARATLLTSRIQFIEDQIYKNKGK